jgi:ABC-2 type transport system permease protein
VRSSFVSVALAVAWRNLHNYFSNPSLFLPGVAFPLFFFIAFAGGLSAVSRVPGFDYPPGYTSFQYVFVLLQGAAFGGVFTAFSIARDFEGGFGRRLLLAAPRRSGIVAGYAIAGVVRFAFVAAITTAVAFAAGMEVVGSGIDLFGLYLLALFLNLAAGFWASGIALRLRTIQAGPLMQVPVFMLLFFAPVYVPLELLEGWIHAFATANPVTYLLTAGRGFLAGDPVYVALAFGLVLACGLALAVWARRGLRAAERAG